MALVDEAGRLIDLAREEGRAAGLAEAAVVSPKRIAVVVLRSYADAMAATSSSMTDLPVEGRDALAEAVSGLRAAAAALEAPPAAPAEPAA